MSTKIFAADDPLVTSGTYDVYGYTPAERRLQQRRERDEMAKKSKPNGKSHDEPAKRGARSQPLPGMEGVRSKRLDNLCESIGEHREKMNAARTEEQSDIVAALQEMQKKKISVYKHGGVELARVPGAEKLRVRLTKEQGDADVDDLEDGEFAAERRAATAD